MIRYLFIALLLASAFAPPATALFAGILFALIFGHPYPAHGRKLSKYLLQVAVVGLGFGMDLHRSLEAGRNGMAFTIISVTGVMALGYFIGRWMRIAPKLTHLISSGTAICGGSAIAAVSPIVGAGDDETSMSLAVVFTLNAVALFIFPPIGRAVGLTQEQFGLWSAIAIHDTSSVVGAGATYGPVALAVATTVKLTRALWIIPLSFASMFFFRDHADGAGSRKVHIPWFILLFVVAMVLNTYIPAVRSLSHIATTASHRMLSATLFLIGSSLSVKSVKSVGVRPILLGVALWVIISVATLTVCML